MFKIFKKKHHVAITVLPIHYEKATAIVTQAYFEYEVDAETFIKNITWYIKEKGFLTLGNVFESANMKPSDQLDSRKLEQRLYLNKTNFKVDNLLPRCYLVDLPLIEYKEDQNE